MDRQNARILNLQNSIGRTALHYACAGGNDLATEALLKLGATVERYLLNKRDFSRQIRMSLDLLLQ